MTAAAHPSLFPDPLLDGYRPLPGIPDEAVTPDGAVRSHWRPVFDRLGELGPEGMAARFAAADRYLREAGVFYRVYDTGGGERPWPLAHVPLVLPADEWAAIRDGLTARANLLDAVLADLYGPQALVRDGTLPAALVAGNAEYLRPLAGTVPVGGRGLRFYAVDLGRGPDGRWWVLSDRTQAPSGAGYALENRIAIGRALGDLSNKMNVERLAGFFQGLRTTLSELADGAEARAGLLTPGPFNETYFEHAYLARYLGLLLVEGADLTVQGGQVFVRTIEGLRRISVLWRRLDGDFADPLELNAASQLGVPGLVQAVRSGGIALVNQLGSGVLEVPALMGFVKTLAERLGHPAPTLPNIATWWCGQPAERAVVRERLAEMVVAPALGRATPLLPDRRPILGADLLPEARERLAAGLDARGADVVGQEVVRLSTMPVWTGGRLEPRPFTLRVFLARGADGWSVMPGGFCRIATNQDARAVTMQQGDLSADVWVLADKAVPQTSLLPGPGRETVRRSLGTLPSRAADNLYWLGRYLERLEAHLRMLRALAIRRTEGGADDPVVPALIRALIAVGALPAPEEGETTLPGLTAAFGPDAGIGAVTKLSGMVAGAAATVRDRLSPDGWRALSRLTANLPRPLPEIGLEGAAIDRINLGLTDIAAFSGLAQENMTRQAGWRFLEIGRRVERAGQGLDWLSRFVFARDIPGSLDLALELADSVITYRQRYAIATAPTTVIDLLLLDPGNPRSVASQVQRLRRHLEVLPGFRPDNLPSPWARLAIQVDATLSTLSADRIDGAQGARLAAQLRELSDALTVGYFAIPQRSRPNLAEDRR